MANSPNSANGGNSNQLGTPAPKSEGITIGYTQIGGKTVTAAVTENGRTVYYSGTTQIGTRQQIQSRAVSQAQSADKATSAQGIATLNAISSPTPKAQPATPMDFFRASDIGTRLEVAPPAGSLPGTPNTLVAGIVPGGNIQVFRPDIFAQLGAQDVREKSVQANPALRSGYNVFTTPSGGEKLVPTGGMFAPFQTGGTKEAPIFSYTPATHTIEQPATVGNSKFQIGDKVMTAPELISYAATQGKAAWQGAAKAQSEAIYGEASLFGALHGIDYHPTLKNPLSEKEFTGIMARQTLARSAGVSAIATVGLGAALTPVTAFVGGLSGPAFVGGATALTLAQVPLAISGGASIGRFIGLERDKAQGKQINPIEEASLGGGLAGFVAGAAVTPFLTTNPKPMAKIEQPKEFINIGKVETLRYAGDSNFIGKGTVASYGFMTKVTPETFNQLSLAQKFGIDYPFTPETPVSSQVRPFGLRGTGLLRTPGELEGAGIFGGFGEIQPGTAATLTMKGEPPARILFGNLPKEGEGIFTVTQGIRGGGGFKEFAGTSRVKLGAPYETSFMRGEITGKDTGFMSEMDLRVTPGVSKATIGSRTTFGFTDIGEITGMSGDIFKGISSLREPPKAPEGPKFSGDLFKNLPEPFKQPKPPSPSASEFSGLVGGGEVSGAEGSTSQKTVFFDKTLYDKPQSAGDFIGGVAAQVFAGSPKVATSPRELAFINPPLMAPMGRIGEFTGIGSGQNQRFTIGILNPPGQKVRGETSPFQLFNPKEIPFSITSVQPTQKIITGETISPTITSTPAQIITPFEPIPPIPITPIPPEIKPPTFPLPPTAPNFPTFRPLEGGFGGSIFVKGKAPKYSPSLIGFAAAGGRYGKVPKNPPSFSGLESVRFPFLEKPKRRKRRK